LDMPCIIAPASYCLAMGVETPASTLEAVGAAAPESEVVADVGVLRLRQTTQPRGRGGQFSFNPDVLLRAWLLLSSVRSSGLSLKATILRAMRLAIEPEQFAAIQRMIDSGELWLPGLTCMEAVEYKVNLIDLHFQRHAISSTSYSRHWMADSSPQLGFNYFAVYTYRHVSP